VPFEIEGTFIKIRIDEVPSFLLPLIIRKSFLAISQLDKLSVGWRLLVLTMFSIGFAKVYESNQYQCYGSIRPLISFTIQ